MKIYCKKLLVMGIILSFIFTTAVFPQSVFAARVPEAPDRLKAKAHGYDGIILTWNEVRGAVEYYIYRYEPLLDDYDYLDSTSDNEYIDEDLDRGKTYYYKVKAVDSYGEESDFSEEEGARVGYDDDEDLDAPDDLEAEAIGSDAIELTWDEVDDAEEYYIYRSESSSGRYKFLDSTDDTEYIDDEDLEPGKTYYYKVTAVDKHGYESDFSNRVRVKLDMDDDDDIDIPSGHVIETGRMAGQNRYDTAGKISSSGWSTSYYAVIASGEDYADAICSVPLAYKYSAPVLLTSQNSLPIQSKTQLTNLKVKHVFLIGGTKVISTEVENAIRNMGIQVTRIAGSNRYQTSVLVAAYVKQTLGRSGTAVLAPGTNFYDALSIASIAAVKGYPILLSPSTNLTSELKTYINNNITQTVVVGDTLAISDTIFSQLPSPSRICGKDRYETNLKVIQTYADILNFDNCYLATGEVYADALSGLPLAALKKAPVFLVGRTVDETTASYIKNKNAKKIIAFGGTAAIPDHILQSLRETGSNSDRLLSAPTNLQAVARDSDEIKLTWNRVSNATDYYIYRAESSSGPYERIGKTKSTSYTDRGLEAGERYYYKVRASNSSGTSDYSARAYATTEDSDDFEAPDDLEAEATGPDSIRLTWDEVDDAMAYWVYRSESSSGEYILIGGTDQDYFIDSNLKRNRTYYYKVKAVSKYGEESDFSNRAHATTDKK